MCWKRGEHSTQEIYRLLQKILRSYILYPVYAQHLSSAEFCSAIRGTKINFRAQASIIWALSHEAKTEKEKAAVLCLSW